MNLDKDSPAGAESRNDTTPTRAAGKLMLAGVALICVATSKAPPVPPADVPMWSIASQPLTLRCGTAEVWVSKSGKTGLGLTVRIAPDRRGATGHAQVAVDPATTPPPPGPASEPEPPSQIAVEPATSPTGPSNPPSPPRPIVPPEPARPIDPACGATGIAATLTFSDRAFTGRLVVQQRSSELQEERRHGVVMPASSPDATYYYLAFELDNEARWNRGDRTATLELVISADHMVHRWTMPATHAYRTWPLERR